MLERLRKSARSLSILGDHFRQELYVFVRERGSVTREEVSERFGISRNLAAFHLEKLVERHLLSARQGDRAGPGGPGAGRPPKVYEPSDMEFELTVPERRYDVVGKILVAAMEEQREGEPARDAARRVARERGEAFGRKSAARSHPTAVPDAMKRTTKMLKSCGYEPFRQNGDILLRNCPFHRLAEQAPELVCGINQAFLDGYVRGLSEPPLLEAVLDPREGRCCVRLSPEQRGSSSKGKKQIANRDT